MSGPSFGTGVTPQAGHKSGQIKEGLEFKMRIKYETETCCRCHGVGYFAHFSHVKGGRCFRCGGSGITLTRKGEAAKMVCMKALTIRADALEPGMVIWETEVLPMSNDLRNRKTVVESVDITGADVTVITGFAVSHMSTDTPVQQALTPSNREVARAALAGISGVNIED